MARIIKNPLGELSGIAGELVFKSGKNGNYISSKPTPTRKKPSAVQELQRNKMKLVMDFLQPMQGLIKECYFPFGKNKSGFHAAKSHYLKYALRFEQEAYHIDYPKALISFGDLRPPEEVKLEAIPATDSFRVSWSNNSLQAMAAPDDRLLFACYAPGQERFFYQTNCANRDESTFTFQLNNSWQGMSFHVWVGFQRPEEQRASPSYYAGKIDF